MNVARTKIDICKKVGQPSVEIYQYTMSNMKDKGYRFMIFDLHKIYVSSSYRSTVPESICVFLCLHN